MRKNGNYEPKRNFRVWVLRSGTAWNGDETKRKNLKLA